jgi:DNA polymerase
LPPGPPGLRQLEQQLQGCQRCRLGRTRTNLVFGTGDPEADLMFIGEAPGRDEDLQGEPFVGAAGQLLTRMIAAMGLDREQVYIANIVKCRPPRNRDPAPDEIEACERFLRQQIDQIQPSIIIALGSYASRTLLRSGSGIKRLRGRWHRYHDVPLMPTYHPAYLLRNTGAKREAWHDLKLVMAEMDRLGLERRRQG